MLRPLHLMSALVLFPFAICQAGSIQKTIRWVVCYSDKPRGDEFIGFDLAVLDSDAHPPLPVLAGRTRSVLACLSLGEVAKHRVYFDAVQAEGILLGENQNWKGSFFVDVRDPRWRQRVVGQLVPSMLASYGYFLSALIAFAAAFLATDRSSAACHTTHSFAITHRWRNDRPLTAPAFRRDKKSRAPFRKRGCKS